MDILSTLFHQQSRAIGLIIPDVVISEKHSDRLEITEHPVEIGAAVADHAYKHPAELVMEVGFAAGGSLLDFADMQAAGLSAGLSPAETYKKLLDLQADRVTFDVMTGKRQYKNMLIRAIEATTDRASENVLMATLTLREVIITSTQSVQVADKQNMAQGVNTSSVQNSGVKTVKPVNESVLSQVLG